MPTKKPRFNITFDQPELATLTILAKKQNRSIAGMAKELILEALERHEDMVLSTIADERLEEAEKKSQKMISHEDAWK
jgi:predicted DNA-binding protein